MVCGQCGMYVVAGKIVFFVKYTNYSEGGMVRGWDSVLKKKKCIGYNMQKVKTK